MLIWIDRPSHGADAVRVQGCLLVPFDDAGPQLFAQVREGADQEGGLACARGTHHIQRPDSAAFQPAPVPRREHLVLVEQALLQRNDLRSVIVGRAGAVRMLVGVPVPVLVRMRVVVGMNVVVGVIVLVVVRMNMRLFRR